MPDEVTVMVFWVTRQEMLRTFATIRRNWRKVARSFGFGDHDARFALGAMRRMARETRKWSAPSDLARVALEECCDIKCLCLAVEGAMPGAMKTIEKLWHIADAAAHGYWSAGSGDTETYRRTRDGWSFVEEDEAEDETEEDNVAVAV